MDGLRNGIGPHSPLFMLGILAADDVDILPALAPHALAAVAELLNGAAHLHASDMLFLA